MVIGNCGELGTGCMSGGGDLVLVSVGSDLEEIFFDSGTYRDFEEEKEEKSIRDFSSTRFACCGVGCEGREVRE